MYVFLGIMSPISPNRHVFDICVIIVNWLNSTSMYWNVRWFCLKLVHVEAGPLVARYKFIRVQRHHAASAESMKLKGTGRLTNDYNFGRFRCRLFQN